MSDQDKSDHWDLLATGLGATPPADDEVESADADEPEGIEPSPQAEIEEPTVEFSRPRAVHKTAPPTDWGKLAGDLGVEFSHQSPEPALGGQDTSPPPANVDEPQLSVEDASGQPRLLAESDDQDEVADEDNELAELVLDARDGGDFASGVFDDPIDAESDDEGVDLIADIAEVDDLDTNADAADMDIDMADTDVDAADMDIGMADTDVDAADMDIGTADTDADVADTDERPPEKKPGRRRRRRRPRRRKSTDDQSGTRSEPATDDQSDEAVGIIDGETLETSLTSDETESASTDSEEPQTKPKRRRRRRGSGKKTATASEDDQSAEKESPKSDDEAKILSDETPKRRGRRRTSPGAKSKDGEKEKSGKTAKRSHRAIPSWAEAIEVVISANVENHKKRNPSGGHSRPRGGRKRGVRDKSSDKAK